MTVAWRIKEMVLDTEQQSCATLRKNPFNIQLDETTTIDNDVLLMAYVHYMSESVTLRVYISPLTHEGRQSSGL